MPRDVTETRLYIKEIWEEAYKEPIYFDFSNEELGAIKTKNLFNLLSSYKTITRRKRMNPQFSAEWGRMANCTIWRLSPTKLMLYQRPPLTSGRDRRRPFQPPNLPLLVPKSVGTMLEGIDKIV